VGEVNILQGEIATATGDFFDRCYGTMLQLMARFFLVADESEAEAEILMHTAVGLMKTAIEPLGRALTALPAGASLPTRRLARVSW
jgi:hypothetical protein